MVVRHERGFTIVELTLAVVFVSILLLLVATVTIHIGNLYEKGVTIKSINQVGREVMDTLDRDIAQAGDQVKFEAVGSGANINYRLCLGGISYLANSGASLNDSAGARITYSDGGKFVTFARVVDDTASFCNQTNEGIYRMTVNNTAQSVELLSASTTTLAVHDFLVEPLTQDTSQSLYRVTLVIGTNEVGTLDTDYRCRTGNAGDDDYGANFNYCSVAEFTTIIRSGGAND